MPTSIILRPNLSADERRQLTDAARNANAEPHEVYAAIRACASSYSADLETTLKPDEARVIVKDFCKELERTCPSHSIPDQPSSTPQQKTKSGPKPSSGG